MVLTSMWSLRNKLNWVSVFFFNINQNIEVCFILWDSEHIKFWLQCRFNMKHTNLGVQRWYFILFVVSEASCVSEASSVNGNCVFVSHFQTVMYISTVFIQVTWSSICYILINRLDELFCLYLHKLVEQFVSEASKTLTENCLA